MSQHIPDSVIEEIRTRTDIIAVVGDYVSLKKRGQNHVGLCPFHSEKTASFNVSSGKQFYHCFGCDTGGSVFKFLMEIENISFVDAVKKLADRTGVKIPDPVRSPEATQAQKEKDFLIHLHELAMEYFTSSLDHASLGGKARAYLNSRHFDAPAFKTYQLGWSPPGWDGLSKYLRKKSRCSAAQIEKAGLAIRKEEGKAGHYYDRFRERIMFPLKSAHGKIVGFAGRVIGDGEPKYLNSPETILYKKSQELYGFFDAKSVIRQRDQILIVEGYFDQIRLSGAGIKNTVATCGTALTASHVNRIKALTSHVVLVFDSDSAGKAAAKKGYDLLLDQGMDVKIISLPEGQDPDSFVLEQGPEVFLKKVESAKPYIESFIMDAIQDGSLATPPDRLAIADKVLPLLAKIGNQVERSEWVKFLSERTGLHDSALLAEIRKSLAQRQSVAATQESAKQNKQNPELYLVHLMFSDKNVARTILDQISIEEFQDPALRSIAQALNDLMEKGAGARIDQILDRLENPEEKALLTRIGLELIAFEDPKTAAGDCIRQIKIKKIEAEMNALKKERNEAQTAGQWDRSRELNHRLQEIRHSLALG